MELIIKMETKFIFISLVIRNGHYTYGSSKVYEIPKEKDMQEFALQVVKNYHIGEPLQKFPDTNWWYFFGGEVSVMLETAEEIREQEYIVLNKFQYK